MEEKGMPVYDVKAKVEKGAEYTDKAISLVWLLQWMESKERESSVFGVDPGKVEDESVLGFAAKVMIPAWMELRVGCMQAVGLLPEEKPVEDDGPIADVVDESDSLPSEVPKKMEVGAGPNANFFKPKGPEPKDDDEMITL